MPLSADHGTLTGSTTDETHPLCVPHSRHLWLLLFSITYATLLLILTTLLLEHHRLVFFHIRHAVVYLDYTLAGTMRPNPGGGAMRRGAVLGDFVMFKRSSV